MNCPVCKDTNLTMTERQGIEIDYCPNCRGVWLDRGELDKIIDRSIGAQTPQMHQADHLRKHDDYHKHSYNKKKREGFLGDLFDF